MVFKIEDKMPLEEVTIFFNTVPFVWKIVIILVVSHFEKII